MGQGRSELLCGALVLALALIPEIEERLREVLPGKGRQSSATEISGSTNAFLLDKRLGDKLKQVNVQAWKYEYFMRVPPEYVQVISLYTNCGIFDRFVGTCMGFLRLAQEHEFLRASGFQRLTSASGSWCPWKR